MNDLQARYRKVRDIILAKDLLDPSTLGTRLRALYTALQELGSLTPRREGEYWIVRGSMQGRDEENRPLYVWHRATLHTCTCAAFYSAQSGITVNPLTCSHRMVAWLCEIGG
jgi:hypothetical protein